MIVFFLSTAAHATKSWTREGAYGRAALGIGLGQKGYGEDRDYGGSGSLSLGVAMSDKMLIGFNVDLWNQEQRLRLMNIGLSMSFYAYDITFFRFGPSLAMAESQWERGSSGGFGYVAACGFEAKIVPRIALQTAVSYSYARAFEEPVSADCISFLLGLVAYSGRRDLTTGR